jgi:hypothetical protein
MKEVILSADGDRVVYLVPDVVADNLKKYCLNFCTKWIRTDPHAKKYRKETVNMIKANMETTGILAWSNLPDSRYKSGNV